MTCMFRVVQPSLQLILHFHHPKRNPMSFSSPPTPAGVLLPEAPGLLGSSHDCSGGSVEDHVRGSLDQRTRLLDSGALGLHLSFGIEARRRAVLSRVCGASRLSLYMTESILHCIGGKMERSSGIRKARDRSLAH